MTPAKTTLLSECEENPSHSMSTIDVSERDHQGFPGSSEGKASAYSVRDPGSIPGSGRSPGEGNGNSLQYACLENPMDQGAW